ncbi:unnamed protein product [marine sediment metagenome]|uniref:Uncharacterized protein n=1 Tax=marine sediment metagenome TaxID=412755 RepID=X0SAF4_9ZZZZ
MRIKDSKYSWVNDLDRSQHRSRYLYRSPPVSNLSLQAKAKSNIWTAYKRAASLNSVPTWYSAESVLPKYLIAHEKTRDGVKHSVDHYYPLNGPTVSGLHCDDNLQVITLGDNIRKGNKNPDDGAI